MQVFPERISNKVATAGDKALKSESFSPDRKKSNKKIRNNSKALSSSSCSSSRISTSTSKKNVGGQDTGVIVLGDGNSVFQGDSSDNTIDAAAGTTTSTVLVVEGTAEVASSGSTSVSASSGGGDESGSTRPAVTCERLSNVAFPYITGIVVRP